MGSRAANIKQRIVIIAIGLVCALKFVYSGPIQSHSTTAAAESRQLFHNPVREPVQADFAAPYHSGHDATRSQVAASPATSGRLP
jgi:hypothetical protein